MVRKKSPRKKDPVQKKSSVGLESPRRSTQTSMSPITTPKRKSSPRGKQLNVQSKVKSIHKKKKKASSQLRVGSKIFKVSGKILREIKHYQTSTNNLIPKLPFARLVQEIMSIYVPQGRRIQRIALEALHESAEHYLVQYMEDSYSCSLHARRSTLLPRDMELVECLRRNT